MGTPEVSARALRALHAAGHDVRVVVTRPDARRQRRGPLAPSPVKLVATELGIRVVHRPEDALGSRAELGVVVAYGRLVKPDVLAELPMVNVHFSLLPRWRGAAPVERALLAGDSETGVSIMALDEGLDTGPVYARALTSIGPEETAEELRFRLGQMGTDLLLRLLADGLGTPEPQSGVPTYAPKVEPAELRLDFSQPAENCERVVRVGRAWTTWRGRRLLVLKARAVASTVELLPGELRGTLVGTGSGHLLLTRVQVEGKAPMDAQAWERGARTAPGERLGG
ncbi:MAG: methionyl-tRNA formyltransferase [Acidimicrobiales bacterium]